MTNRHYTDADAAFDNEQAGGCPIHGLDHAECDCARRRCHECGGWDGKHADDCEDNPDRKACAYCGFLAPLGEVFCDEECAAAAEQERQDWADAAWAVANDPRGRPVSR